MRVDKLADMTRGWVAGDFAPSVLRTKAFEVAVQHFKAGDVEAAHYHAKATEITVIVLGQVRMFGQTFAEGDVVTAEPGDVTSFEALTDAITTVIKTPSVPNDKFIDQSR